MEDPKSFKRLLLRTISYILVAVLASAGTLAIFGGQSKLEQLEKILEKYYVGQTDSQTLQDGAAQGMVAALADQWSYYVSASEYAAYQANKDNAYVGIGITIALREDGTGFDITRVEPESPALEAGVLPGDILVQVQGQSVAGMDISGPGAYIKGEPGEQVTITVLRGTQTHSFTMERRRIQTQVAAGQMLPGDVGYVKITNFNDNCARQTLEQIDKLIEQGAKALIFDVRDNPGGYRSELVAVLDHLLPEGPVFRSVSYNGVEQTDTSDEQCLDLPMAVLVNGQSYSAAEFFAAALSEYDRAVVVGEPTCGKGYYQQTFRLSDGSAVGLSTGAYYTPKGVNLAEVGGLIPDLIREVDEKTAQQIYAGILDPMEDPQILGALELLQ